MNSDPAEAATLLECLRAPFRGLYLRFPYFLRPFDEFIFKKYARRKKKPKELPTKENIGSQFYGFFSNALHLVEEHLGRSPCNGAEGDERMQEEKITELFGIYRLITNCLLCIASCLSGKSYTVQLIWGKLVMRLRLWNKHSEAKEEGLALFKSIRTLNSTVHFLPDPSAAGSTGADSLFAYLVCDLVIVLTLCAFMRQSRATSDFNRILALAEQTHPWIWA